MNAEICEPMADIFNSKTKPVPRLRPDLNIIPVQQNGNSYLYFHDMRGYVPTDFALDRSVGGLLSLLDGRKSINDLRPHLGKGVDTDQLLKYIQFLDENRLLNSAHFSSFAEHFEQNYEESSVHYSTTAGGSYPSDPDELHEFLDEAFAKHTSDQEQSENQSIKALYAPHIDPRVGMKSYVQAFSRLKHCTPKRVVLLATSHYAGYYPDIYSNTPFIVSHKDFEMPMGTIPADCDAIDGLLNSEKETGLTARDRAHRIEHSIELHLLFLQHIWQHQFSIVPIVVTGFDDLFYMPDGYLNTQLENFTRLLRDQFGQDDETLFLISGDLAHVGKKFGDNQPANAMQNEVALFDEQFLAAGQKNAPDAMLELMKRNHDPYRICGFPPLYTFLRAFPELTGQTVSYQRWDENERESAVTFGSILYS